MTSTLLLVFATLLFAAAACTGGQPGATSNIAATVEGRTQTTQETDPPSDSFRATILRALRLAQRWKLELPRLLPCRQLGMIRDWRLAPSAEGLELALVRLDVQNHTAVSAVVNIERSLVLLRDSTGESYFPFDIAASVRQDLRGSPSARIRIDEGQCFDPNRVVVDVGAELQWVNEGQTAVVLHSTRRPACRAKSDW